MKRFGVIDLGTNTFHLLIAEVNESGQFRDLYRQRIFVKLAEEGIEKIGMAPFHRGLQALKEYRNILHEYGVINVRAFGTAALRTAINGNEFIQKVKAITGIQIQLIPGKEEARLIHKGVSLAVPMSSDKSLIMDIGGGSVEFIIAGEERFYWSQSFPIGVAVLFRELHHSDPINQANIEGIESFLEKELQPLWEALSLHPCQNLIGASGTFDVIDQFLGNHANSTLYSRVTATHFRAFYQQLIQTNLEQRLALEKLPSSRAELIIVALILIDYVMRRASIQQIIVSAYAMKEGILKEMMEEI